VTVADATGFVPGGGITVRRRPFAGGFHVTVTRIVAVEGNVLHLAQPLLADYTWWRTAPSRSAGSP
jgi:hypothetical protein